MTLKKLVFTMLLTTTAALSTPSANAWGWAPVKQAYVYRS